MKRILPDDDLDKTFDELEREFIEQTVEDAYSKLSEEDKKDLLEHPDPFDHHFGYGLYIRNQYIHGKELSFPCVFADNLSTEIVRRIILKVQENQ
ncbi:MAG: hypothetical protein J5623_00550 [Clostridiales bacterium]|nr:hypothetical protein [Clostridiales bacterium]